MFIHLYSRKVNYINSDSLINKLIKIHKLKINRQKKDNQTYEIWFYNSVAWPMSKIDAILCVKGQLSERNSLWKFSHDLLLLVQE